MKLNYLINSFYFQKQLFEKYLNEKFVFHFSPPVFETSLRGIFYIPYNFFCMFWLYLSGNAKKYQIIHFNRAEAFLLWHKIPGQISIFEIHGFDVGVNGEFYLRDLHSKFKYHLGMFIDKLISRRIIKNIQKIDLFYCSTPDLVEPIEAWCGRRPLWLPNPVDVDLFTPEGPITKLEGEPACFLAARLHGDKKPEIAIEIFQKNIKTKYPNATLHLLSTGELAEKYRQELSDQKTYFWHPYMDKKTLASKLRGADLIFGDFSIGALSLLPMQVMLLKKPIVTLDNYEIIKTGAPELSNLTDRLLADKTFRDEFIERNYIYVKTTHSAETIANLHYENIKKLSILNL